METLITQLDTIILSFVQGAFGSLTPAIQTLWRMMFVIFIAVYGYKIMISGRFSAADLLSHCVKIIILLALATQWDLFFLIVFNMLTDLPSDIAGQIMQAAAASFGAGAQAGTVDTANTALSRFFERGMAVSATVLQGAGWRDIGQYLYAFAIWLGTIGLTGYAAMLIILAKLAVAVLLGIGPLFILLLIFANTRALFEGWLRTLLNYALIPVFVYTLLAILLTLAEAPLAHLEAHSGAADALISAVGPFLLISTIAVLLLAQILNIAASVTGGVSLSTMGFARAGLRGPQEIVKRGGALGWSKSAPIRAYAGDKFKAGTKRGYDAGKQALSRALSKTREVR